MSPGSKTPKLEGAIGVRPAAALIARAHPHGLPQIRLLKLLWLAELRYYERTGNRLTSAGWWRWDFGPYSKDVINTVKREGKWFRIEKPSDPTQRGLVIHAALGARPGGRNAEGATVIDEVLRLYQKYTDEELVQEVYADPFFEETAYSSDFDFSRLTEYRRTLPLPEQERLLRLPTKPAPDIASLFAP